MAVNFRQILCVAGQMWYIVKVIWNCFLINNSYIGNKRKKTRNFLFFCFRRESVTLLFLANSLRFNELAAMEFFIRHFFFLVDFLLKLTALAIKASRLMWCWSLSSRLLTAKEDGLGLFSRA
jgi:hypothetical protein